MIKQMHLLLAAALVVALSATAHAGTQRGDWGLSVGGAYTHTYVEFESDFVDGQDSYNLAVQTRVSYFVTDSLELAGSALVSLGWTDERDSLIANTSLGFETIYNFNFGESPSTIPYIGGGVGAFIYDTGGNGDTEVWPEIHGIVGMKQFLNEDTAFFVEYRPQYIFTSSDSGLDFIFLNQIFFGMNFYW